MNDFKHCVAIVALLSAGLLVGCGQKGALYLPDHNGTVVTRPAATPAGTEPSESTSPAASPQSNSPPPPGTNNPQNKQQDDQDQPPKS